MGTTLTDTLLSLFLGGTYFFMVLLTTYLGRKSNLHWGLVAIASLLFTPIVGMLLLLWFGERMNSYHRVERLKQLRDQGILNEEEFNWKYYPATPEMLLRELAILRDEGVLTRSEYSSKAYRIKEEGVPGHNPDHHISRASRQTEIAV
ncbi:hypothetical protein OKW21_003512 [Catalinimonas alkaloidigena]|uniref:SHOCT domain-containing protein n=1 Tax=Catalinimonas alkaloidigena TaxID=1075417 RepID=UPI002406B834|nr:SHOCT domain-containing protein [Catalinimonas alkaloidigena]MDF9798249.1 hypothetical protein [Catalinimonas alkaloidigena]